MTYADFRHITLTARLAARAAATRPLCRSAAYQAAYFAAAAFDAAVLLDDGSDVALAIEADYREAILGGLGGSL